jgi:hypothetical protein
MNSFLEPHGTKAPLATQSPRLPLMRMPVSIPTNSGPLIRAKMGGEF